MMDSNKHYMVLFIFVGLSIPV